MKKPGNFSLKISFKQDEGLRSSYNVPDEDATMEFAVSMRKLHLQTNRST